MPDGIERRPVSRRDLVLGAAAGGAAAAAAIGGAFIPGSGATAAPPAAGPAPAAVNPVPASAAPAPPPQLGGLDDWLGSLVQVANVAANMLPLVLLTQDGPLPPPFQTGGIQFEYMNLNNSTDLYAHNISGEDTGMSYSVTRSEPSLNLSVYQPLPAGGVYKCQPDLSEFVDGQVYLAPNPVATAANGALTRAISFAVRGLAIGATVNVIGGVRATVKKDPASGQFTAEITTTGAPKALRAQIAATGPDGNVVRAEWNSDAPPTPTPSSSPSASAGAPADTVIDIPLPVGVNLDPVVQTLEIYLDVDQAGFDQATAERRARVIQL